MVVTKTGNRQRHRRSAVQTDFEINLHADTALTPSSPKEHLQKDLRKILPGEGRDLVIDLEKKGASIGEED